MKTKKMQVKDSCAKHAKRESQDGKVTDKMQSVEESSKLSSSYCPKMESISATFEGLQSLALPDMCAETVPHLRTSVGHSIPGDLRAAHCHIQILVHRGSSASTGHL